MLTIAPGKVKGLIFDEGTFRDQLSKLGDSLLVVADDELVKVHIHAEYPGEVMNQAMNYGALSRIKIENMRDQHSHILEDMTRRVRSSCFYHGHSCNAKQAVWFRCGCSR